jgi:hypothetical protein
MKITSYVSIAYEFTERTQNPPRATSWGFDPPPGTKILKDLQRKWPLRRERPFSLVAVLVAVCFYEVAELLFVNAMVCNESQRVTFPEFPERSRGRIGVKAAHPRAASRSQRLDSDS